jgi:predicted DCC family thiol-disulfide oxidoreductase YuxK
MRTALGEMAQLLVDGQRVLPFRARCEGFEFDFATLPRALDALYPRTHTALRASQILYDPVCPVCDLEMRRYCAQASRSGLRWMFADVAASPEIMEGSGIDADTARRRVYLIDADGRIHSGIDALTIIWSSLPRWRVVGGIVSLPVIRVLANLFYDLALAPLIWRWSTRRRSRGVKGIALSHS